MTFFSASKRGSPEDLMLFFVNNALKIPPERHYYAVTAQIFKWPSLTQNLVMHYNNNFLISSPDQGCLSPTYLLYV